MMNGAKRSARGKREYPVVAIDRNIPIPPPGHASEIAAFYPWGDLLPGDSFLMQTDNPNNATNAARQAARKRPGWKFTTRKLPEGVRVWRVE